MPVRCLDTSDLARRTQRFRPTIEKRNGHFVN